MLTMEQITEILRDGFERTLRMHMGARLGGAPAMIRLTDHGHAMLMDPIKLIASDAANNITMVLMGDLGEHLDSAHETQLENESLRAKLMNAGGHGATLDVMLTSVLEAARISHAAKAAAQQLVDASTALLEAFDEGDVDAFHPDADADPIDIGGRSIPVTVECPEDDTCTCAGPKAINDLARARDAARRELPAMRDLTH